MEETDWEHIVIERIDTLDGGDMNVPPPHKKDIDERFIEIGMEFNSVDEAWDCWRKYAKKQGFGVRKNYANKRKKDGVVSNSVFVCCKEGIREEDKRVKDKSRQRCEVRTGCKVRLNVALNTKTGKYMVRDFVDTHNHELESEETIRFFRSNRNVSISQQLAINLAHDSGLTPKATQELLSNEAGGGENLGFIKEDQKTYLRNRRKKDLMLGELGSIVKYFEEKKTGDSSFSHDFQFDECGLVTNIFWVDGRMKVDYIDFGDVITFDTTYGTNKELRPLGVFTGFNHHREITIFGAALLYEKTVESFVWLFETFVRAHSGKKSVSIFTDQDAAMAKALNIVMRDTYHGLCTWHINQNALKHLSCYHRPESDLLGDFSKCMYLYDDVDEFEKAWINMLEKHSLQENKWLKRTYAVKVKWARCYMKYAFTLGVRSTQLSESLNKDLKNYLNCNLNASDFFNHFDRVVVDKRDKELASEFRARQQVPLLSIPECLMLQKASKRYTPTIFNHFQEEYKHSSMTIVKDKEKSETPKWFIIVHHSAMHKEFKVVCDMDGIFKCSCMMFETRGYICSHIIRVFRFFDIFEIPEKYILSRWTRRARKIHNTNSKDRSETIPKWTERIQSMLLRMTYHAAKSTTGRGLMDEMIDQYVDKIYDVLMEDESMTSDVLMKNVENSLSQLKGLKKKEGKKRTKRMKPQHETRVKKIKKHHVQNGTEATIMQPQEFVSQSQPEHTSSCTNFEGPNFGGLEY